MPEQYENWQRHLAGDWVGFEFQYVFDTPGRYGQPSDTAPVAFRVTDHWSGGYWWVQRIDGKPYHHAFSQYHMLKILAGRMMAALKGQSGGKSLDAGAHLPEV